MAHKNEELWYSRLKELVGFVKENGRLPVKSENSSLYDWVRNTKNSINNNKLSENRLLLIQKEFPLFANPRYSCGDVNKIM